MGFPGGKAGAGVYQRIINEIPPHDVYIEPFLGDGAVMQRKRPAALSIGVDLDADTLGVWTRALRDEGRRREVERVELHQCCGIDWLRHAFALYRVFPGPTPRDDATAAAAAGSCVPAGSRSTAASSGVAGSRCFVYCDPPYLLGTRRSGRIYRHEMTDEQHEDLLGVIKRLPCPVAISGYWSPLYAAALEQWRCISFDAQTRGGKSAREYLWMNYPPPAELHDYRYLGDNKRQRERVARKVRTWSAGLRRLPAHERQAILRGLVDPAAE